MVMETTYTAFFRRELPLEIERRGSVWTIQLLEFGNNSAVRAARMGDPRPYPIIDGPKYYVEECLKEGIEIKPGTIRFELFLLLAQRGDVEIKIRTSEKFDLRKYVSPQAFREGWGYPR